MTIKWEDSGFQKSLQVIGIILLFVAVMGAVRFLLNCLIDLAVLRDTEPLMRQLSQVRRWVCPWWHPRTQPQQQQGQEMTTSTSSPDNNGTLDMDRLLAGLTPSQKQELLASLLKVKVRVIFGLLDTTCKTRDLYLFVCEIRHKSKS